MSFIVIESKFSYNYSNVEMFQNKLLILTLFKYSSDLNFYSVSQITLVVLYYNFPHFSDQRPPHYRYFSSSLVENIAPNRTFIVLTVLS